jgi:hypothetical protein
MPSVRSKASTTASTASAPALAKRNPRSGSLLSDSAAALMSSTVFALSFYPLHRVKILLQTQDSNPLITSGQVCRAGPPTARSVTAGPDSSQARTCSCPPATPHPRRCAATRCSAPCRACWQRAGRASCGAARARTCCATCRPPRSPSPSRMRCSATSFRTLTCQSSPRFEALRMRAESMQRTVRRAAPPQLPRDWASRRVACSPSQRPTEPGRGEEAARGTAGSRWVRRCWKAARRAAAWRRRVGCLRCRGSWPQRPPSTLRPAFWVVRLRCCSCTL